MSAEKPEVGDVWEDSKGMVHISRIFTLSDDTRAIVFINNNNNTVLEDSAREEHFIKMFTYSGKSKASIEDLFCVKENAKNDTQTDLRTIGELQAEINRLKKVLKDIFMIAKRNKSALLATPENNTLSLIENECALALIGESEEK
jgi:hypothetical protein